MPAFGKYFPESLAAALVLAVLALVATVPSLEPMTQLELFGTGFFALFTTQMLLILFWVLSATVVESKRVGAVFDRLAAALPTSQSGVIYATGFLSLLLGWFNWAFGLIGGVVVGQRLCQRAREDGTSVHYPLVLTAGLSSLVVTNQGLSSLGALMMADETGIANFMVEEAGTIAMGEFILHPANLASSVLLVVTLPLLLVALAPDDESAIEPLAERNRILEGSIAETFDHYSPGRPPGEWELGDRLENSRIISLITVVLGTVSFGWHFATGGRLTLPWLTFTLIVVGLFVQGAPMAFRERTEKATKWANHVAIPFLLYAGIWALLNESGLYATIGDAVAATGLPHVALYAVGFVLGLLVPGPGSLWVLQGPAAVAAGSDLVPALVATMYGAGVSNMWLAFLFASILSIWGFSARLFAKYAAVITGYVSLVVVVSLLLF